ncbi:MAG: hypothetical protein LUH17_07975, partial [Acidaminococcaceae bacterium]|nr:hypothetical protein [Acidaminococcaceae bacterium]
MAADYTGTDTLDTGRYGVTYDKIDITMDNPGKDCASIYAYGRSNETIAHDRVTVYLSDAVDTYGYNGIFIDGVAQFNAEKGISVTIDSKGDNNTSSEYQAWRNGLRAGSMAKIDLGTAEASVITINSNAADSYVNSVFVNGESAGAGYETSIKGGDLTVNINKDNTDQQMDYAAGVSLFNGSKMELAGDLKIHLEANGIDGIRGNNQNNDSDINSLQVKNLEIYGKAVNGNGAGIYLMGEHDSVTSSDNTKITIQTEGNAYGIFVAGSDVASSFGKTVIDLTSKTENNDDVIGISQWGSKTDYAGLT